MIADVAAGDTGRLVGGSVNFAVNGTFDEKYHAARALRQRQHGRRDDPDVPGQLHERGFRRGCSHDHGSGPAAG